MRGNARRRALCMASGLEILPFRPVEPPYSFPLYNPNSSFHREPSITILRSSFQSPAPQPFPSWFSSAQPYPLSTIHHILSLLYNTRPISILDFEPFFFFFNFRHLLLFLFRFIYSSPTKSKTRFIFRILRCSSVDRFSPLSAATPKQIPSPRA